MAFPGSPPSPRTSPPPPAPSPHCIRNRQRNDCQGNGSPKFIPLTIIPLTMLCAVRPAPESDVRNQRPEVGTRPPLLPPSSVFGVMCRRNAECGMKSEPPHVGCYFLRERGHFLMVTSRLTWLGRGRIRYSTCQRDETVTKVLRQRAKLPRSR